MSFTYSSYLNLEKLLSLQTGTNGEPTNNERLFIIVHQVYELWFNLMLDTLEHIRDELNKDKLFEAIVHLKTIRMILKTLMTQMDIIGTLSPTEFNKYRNLLGGSSGLQAFQFREIEFILGYKREHYIEFFKADLYAQNKLIARLNEPTIPEALRDYIQRHADKNLDYHQQLIDIYKKQPDKKILLEFFLDIDEGLQEWRYRHVKLVERVIGTKQGLSGTTGVEFLKKTLLKPFFPELWEIRSEF